MILTAEERGAPAPAPRGLQVSCTGAVPPGPAQPYDASTSLLDWIGGNFAAFGDIVKARAFGSDVYLVNDPDVVQHVLRRNWKNYRKGFAIKRIALLLGKGLMVSEGELWKTQRKLIQPAFHRSAIEAMFEVMKRANLDLLDRWERAARRGEDVNVTRDISAMSLATILMALFGRDYDEVEQHFRILTEETARDLEFAQAFNGLRDVVGGLVERRRDSGETALDMLGLLMGLSDADGGAAMSDAQLISEVLTLVVAGHETTASTLNWTWQLISQRPDIEQRLHAEVDGAMDGPIARHQDLAKAPYCRQVLEEAMRLYPAGWLMTRRALADDQLGAYAVPAGAEIYISPYFLHRHPAFWGDAERFDPDRFAPSSSADRPELAMLAFSAGPRNCIGEQFARMEMQVHVTTVARRLRLIYRDPRPPELDVGVNLRSKHDFIMTPELRGPAHRA